MALSEMFVWQVDKWWNVLVIKLVYLHRIGALEKSQMNTLLVCLMDTSLRDCLNC